MYNDYDIAMITELESEVSLMCNLSQGVEEQGKIKANVAAIIKIMHNFGFTMEKAMEGLEISPDERTFYAEQVEAALKENVSSK
jgi:hypothetical protein